MSRAPSKACVLLFARDPVAEEAAKRLRRSRRLFDLAQRRIVEAVAGLPGVELVVAGPGSGDLPQRGTGFGERLLNAFQDARARGFDRIVAVPNDTPQIGRRHLREAFLHLEAREVALGMSPDGGVYLIGARGDVASVFDGVRWRSGSVGSDLMANAPGAALLGEVLADVDGPADVESLCHAALDPELAALLRGLLAAPAFQRPGRDARRETGIVSRLPISRAPPLFPSFR